MDIVNKKVLLKNLLSSYLKVIVYLVTIRRKITGFIIFKIFNIVRIANINSYRPAYINAKNVIAFIAIKIKKYYDTRYRPIAKCKKFVVFVKDNCIPKSKALYIRTRASARLAPKSANRANSPVGPVNC